ncbi:MAG: hypothetical protein D3925_07690 [Candidatus Electrothrix sp. AR5]|nr:hypothetical protein [Candidatus Electrothrix sp. AR5]
MMQGGTEKSVMLEHLYHYFPTINSTNTLAVNMAEQGRSMALSFMRTGRLVGKDEADDNSSLLLAGYISP